MFGTSYDNLPLASEIIVDLKMKLFKWKFFTVTIIAVAIVTAAVMYNIIR